MKVDESNKILVTGASGFIGFHLCKALIESGYNVFGLDNINNYYDIDLKYGRLKELGIYKENIFWETIIQSKSFPNFKFIRMNLDENKKVSNLFLKENFYKICHFAAQAGVRFSIDNPWAYIDSNIIGFLNILEACRKSGVQHLIYASSSSVYGMTGDIPSKTTDTTDRPISIYAVTKKSNELMAYSYSHLYNLKTTGLRLFTVYGPWGRPDMAIFKFTKAILNDEPIQVYNEGKMIRDFTYINDIVNGIMKVIILTPSDGSNENTPRHKVYNIGNSRPESLFSLISIIEEITNKKALIQFLDLQAGDVKMTYSDISDFKNDFYYEPTTMLKEGVGQFIEWYTKYYQYR